MSGIFESEEGGGGAAAAKPARRTPSRRPRALLPTLGVAVLLVILFSVFVEIWTNRLWFQSLGYTEVFTKVLWTRVVLFIVFGLVLAGVTVGTALIAYRSRPILISDGYRNPTVERYQDTLDPIRHWVLIGVGAIMFLFAGASASGQWKTYMLWRNGSPFGQNDVYFGRDIGFFVFGYPWYRYVLSFGFTTLVIALIVAGITHYLYGGIRLQARRDKISSAAQIQLSVLLGLFMLLKAVAYWLDRYGLAMSDNGLFAGVSYTDANAVLPAKNILMVIAAICALLFFANVFRPGWMLPVLGFGLLILSAVLIGGIWPAIVQRFQVKPSEADKEAAYIARNIESTRSAFDINDVKIVQYPGVTTDSDEELLALADSLPGVRLIDPQLVAPAFEQLQQQRGFYQMQDVLDVDRYTLEGEDEPQDIVIAARELNIDGVPADQRNWTNDHTVYTHGYGVVAAFGDERSPNGQPVFAQRDLPSVGQLGDFEQRIYFGETEPDYSIVGAPEGSPPVELNIPDVGGDDSDSQNTTYDGEGGVPIGSTVNQALYAAKFWDSSILLSGRVNSESRLIYDRDPHDMVSKVAPWLTVDGDPYPAVVDERLVWILDGYTTSSHYPMSDLIDVEDATNDSLTERAAVASQQSNDINYIRNSVKATVDAYDGTVTLYQWDEEDPVLKAWMSAFPDTVKPKADLSEALLDHLRYPEDMFKVQRDILARYHIEDPNTFYSGSENWRVPEDPTSTGNAQPPFFLTVKMPDEQPEFSLTSVYVPNNRDNMAGFMAVNADAASDKYGEFTVLELPTDTTVSGPGQVANALQQDQNAADRLLPYKQTSQVNFGNLLTLPLGKELIYVQPVYTFRTGAGSYPILQFVLVSVGSGNEDSADQVGIGTSFVSAFANALGLEGPDEPVPGVSEPGGGGGGNNPGQGGDPNDTPQEEMTRLLEQAQEKFADAQTAYDSGDLGAYQDLTNEGIELVRQAIALEQETGAEPPPDGPTTEAPTTGAGS